LSLKTSIQERFEEPNPQMAELEELVIKQGSQLEAANKELEAFAYSVSHDLRAPLRAIDGFSRILMKEYSQQLGPEACHYLQRIRENAQQMASLIDDLLAFSRLGRQPLERQIIAPGNLVRQAFEALGSEQAERSVELIVGDLPPCEADPVLFEQVWIHLLSNALKFTRKRPVAVIEVGCRHAGEEWIYFVRDNGVGFDMRYSSKLFGMFQRLHSVEEYEGRGAGLAIVQRIILRHGGRVWAEAEVGKGATFHFTLGKQCS
jgi:light-regulated signal transduction histidine kinase (bacteriophytochrome)